MPRQIEDNKEEHSQLQSIFKGGYAPKEMHWESTEQAAARRVGNTIKRRLNQPAEPPLAEKVREARTKKNINEGWKNAWNGLGKGKSTAELYALLTKLAKEQNASEILAYFCSNVFKEFDKSSNETLLKLAVIAKDPKLCWFLAANVNKVNSLKKTNVFLILAGLPNEQGKYLFRDSIKFIRSNYTVSSNVLDKVIPSKKQNDVGSLFNLDPLKLPENLNAKLSVYTVETQPDLLRFKPYTEKNAIVNALQEPACNTKLFETLLDELRQQQFSVPHFCIMLKLIFNDCQKNENFKEISLKVLTIMGEKLLEDKRIMDLFSKTPEFFSILSKYMENLPAPQGDAIKQTYPIVTYFRHHADFNLNLFRAKKNIELQQNDPQLMVHSLYDYHAHNQSWSRNLWQGKKPTGEQYKSAFEHFSKISSQYNTPQNGTIHQFLMNIEVERKALTGILGLGSLFSLIKTKTTALDALSDAIKKIFPKDSDKMTSISLLSENDVKTLFHSIQEWKHDKVKDAVKSNYELFQGKGWKPTKVQMLLSTLEAHLEKKLEEFNKKDTSAIVLPKLDSAAASA